VKPSTRKGIAVSVVVGVPLAAALVVSGIEGAEHPYPGVALGSAAVLVIERALAVWAVWLLILVVMEKAWAGRLPDEISGRGVKYAGVAGVEEVRSELQAAIEAQEAATEDTLDRIAALEERLDGAAEGEPGGQHA
jgi:hypothetical protein